MQKRRIKTPHPDRKQLRNYETGMAYAGLKMKKNTSWKFTDESSVTFQSSVSRPGEFGQ